MSLFPVAPQLRLRLPSAVHAGASIVAEILVDAREAIRLDWIDAHLEHTERWSVGTQKNRVSRTEKTLSLRGRVFAGGELAAGAHVFSVRFDLPPWLSPSFALASARAEAQIRIEASIPWWPDATSTFVVPLRAKPNDLAPSPYRVTNGESGGETPRIELSLASSHVAARSVLSGAIAFFHHDASAVLGTHLALRASTRLISRDGRERHRDAITYTVALPPELPVDGTPVPFRFQLPDDVAPTFASPAIALDWQILVQRPALFGTTTWLTIPIAIYEPTEFDVWKAPLEVPAIGDARLTAMLEASARALGLVVHDGSLVGESGGVGFRITRTVRPDVGSALVAELELPRLGLALSVERARMLPQLLQRDIAIGSPELDAAHRVTARDPAQARALLGELADLLGDGVLALLDDERAVLERADPTLDEPALASFARRTAEIANALDAAIARIVPPSGVQVDLDGWAHVARTLEGRFVVGDLSISGRSGESEIAIETRFDRRGCALEHVVRVRPSPELPADLVIAIAEPRSNPAAASAVIAGALASLPERARDLAIAGGEVTLRLPLESEGGDRVRDDPRAALAAALLLARLGALFAPVRGPFR